MAHLPHIRLWIKQNAHIPKDENGWYLAATVRPPASAFVWAHGKGFRNLVSNWSAVYWDRKFLDERNRVIHDVTHWQFAEVPNNPVVEGKDARGNAAHR